MNEKTEYKNKPVYRVDLTKIKGDGAFPCQGCGSIISPKDEDPTKYEILDAKVKKDELESLVIGCKKCGSKTELVGFLTEE